MAAVAYVYSRKTKPNPIAKITDLEVMIRMGKAGAEVPGSKGWTKSEQLFLKCLWS